MTKNGFNYRGHLVFRPYQATVRNELENSKPREFEDVVFNELPSFKEDRSSEVNSGFRKLDKRIEENIGSEILAGIQYIRETPEKIAVFTQGEIKEKKIDTAESVDIFWLHPELLLFRGKKKVVKSAVTELEEIFFDSLLLNKITLQPEFVGEMGYEIRLENEVSGQFRGNEEDIKSATFSGENINEDQVDKGMYDKQELVNVTGSFLFDNHRITASVGKNHIHIYESNDLKNLDSLNRMLLAVNFAKILVEYLSQAEKI